MQPGEETSKNPKRIILKPLSHPILTSEDKLIIEPIPKKEQPKQLTKRNIQLTLN